MNLVEPVHTPELTAGHAIQERMIKKVKANIQTARATHTTIMKSAVTAAKYDTAPMKLTILKNEIA